MRLVGRQNLQEYKDWKGNEEDIKAEYERNKEIGIKCGAWKGGVLVSDDKGLVEKMIKERPVVRNGQGKEGAGGEELGAKKGKRNGAKDEVKKPIKKRRKA